MSAISKETVDKVVSLLYEDSSTKLVLSILINEDNNERVFKKKDLRRVVDASVERDNYPVFLYLVRKYASNFYNEFLNFFLRNSVNSCMLLAFVDNLEDISPFIDTVDSEGKTPLMIAGEENDNPDMFYILLKNGADTSMENDEENDIFQILSEEPVDNDEKLDILYLMRTKKFKDSLPFLPKEVSDKYKDLDGLPKKPL
jgi:hypothetical protein